MSHWVQPAKAAVKILQWAATKTPTPLDDQALSFLAVELDDPAFVAFVDQLIGDKDETTLAARADSAATPEVRMAVEAAGIDWASFLKNVLPLVLQIIALFAKP